MTTQTTQTIKLVLFSTILLYTISTHSVFVAPVNEQEFAELMQQQKPIILQFTAKWCTACLRIKQVIEEVAQEKEFDSVILARIDIDLFGALATRYSLKSIPAFIYINSNGTTNITRTITQDPLRVKDNLQSALRNITTYKPIEENTTQEKTSQQQSASSPIAQLTAFLEYIVTTTSAYIHKITEAIKQLFGK